MNKHTKTMQEKIAKRLSVTNAVALSKVVDVDEFTIRRVAKGEGEPRVSTLKTIAAGLDMEWIDD